jgi:predicted dehydrogenase
MRKLRIGFIGTGLAPRNLHLPALKKLTDRYELVAAVNRRRSKAESFARVAGIRKVVDTVPQLLALNEVEAVVISLPIDQTARYSLQSLRGGKHVLAEKPIAATVAEGKRLLAAAAKLPRKLMIAENFFFDPTLAKAVQLVKSGALGRVRMLVVNQANWIDVKNKYFQTNWRKKPNYAGGFLLDGGIHTANLVREMLGMPVKVKSLVKQFSPFLPPADTLAAVMEFKSGALGVWQNSFAARSLHGEVLEVYGSEANLVLEWGKTRLIMPSGKEKVFRYKGNGYEGEFRCFYDWVVHNRKPLFTPRQALQDLEFIMKLLGK